MDQTINNDNYIISLRSPVPSQREIRNKMYKKFGNTTHVTRTLIGTCAEVTESIIANMLTAGIIELADRAKMHKRYRNERNRKEGKFFVTGYTCPDCLFSRIHIHDKYCGWCGIPLEWK